MIWGKLENLWDIRYLSGKWKTARWVLTIAIWPALALGHLGPAGSVVWLALAVVLFALWFNVPTFLMISVTVAIPCLAVVLCR